MQWPGTVSVSELDKVLIESTVDQSLRDRLLKDPASVLAERGIDVPQGVTINAVEDSRDSHTITLPPYVGSDLSQKSMQAGTAAGQSTTTLECLTCTPTSPICAGSLASLICVTNHC